MSGIWLEHADCKRQIASLERAYVMAADDRDRRAAEVRALEAERDRLTAELATVREELTTTREVMRGTIVDINDQLNARLTERDTLRAALRALVNAWHRCDVDGCERPATSVWQSEPEKRCCDTHRVFVLDGRGADAIRAAVALLDGAKDGR